MDRNGLFAQVAQRYGVEPEYLWPSSPGAAVLRHVGNRKWFGVVMDVPAARLGLEGNDKVDVLNVKVNLCEAAALRLVDGILPAYHMNKEHWVSILLGGRVSDEMLIELLETSYQLTS